METIHTMILDNLEINENESGLSDLDEEYINQKKKHEKLFEIRKIIKKSISDIFNEANNNVAYVPFNKNNININNNIENSKNNSITNECIIEKNNNINNKMDIDERSTTSLNLNSNNEININNDPYSNYNKYNKEFFPKEKKIKERFKDSDPILKEFNPKFLKKENIDKKIFRKFRNFIKEKNITNNNVIIIKNQFWKNFCEKNLLPPMKYIDINNNSFEFKSFNTKYFLWLFSQEGTIQLYNQFLKEQGNSIIDNFINDYNLEEVEKEIINKLRNYLFNISKIYGKNYKKKENLNCDEIFDTFLATYDSDYSQNIFNINFNIEKNYKEDEFYYNNSFLDYNNRYYRDNRESEINMGNNWNIRDI